MQTALLFERDVIEEIDDWRECFSPRPLVALVDRSRSDARSRRNGVFYRAYDARLKRRVALKVLAPELARDTRFRKRFLTKSELAASLDHPNVIPIYEADEAEGVLFVAMRYVDAGGARRRLSHRSD
jgi:serine/threonine protein kinase